MMHSTDIDESPGFVLYLHNKGLVNKSSFIKYTKKKISLVNGNIYKFLGQIVAIRSKVCNFLLCENKAHYFLKKVLRIANRKRK